MWVEEDVTNIQDYVEAMAEDPRYKRALFGNEADMDKLWPPALQLSSNCENRSSLTAPVDVQSLPFMRLKRQCHVLDGPKLYLPADPETFFKWIHATPPTNANYALLTRLVV